MSAAAAVVLYVEDNEAVLRSTKFMLEINGMTVFGAPDRATALAHLVAGVMPDIIICDYNLVTDTGVDIMAYLRDIVGKCIPGIILTGDPSLFILGSNIPPDAEVVYKPMRSGELVKVINALLQQ